MNKFKTDKSIIFLVTTFSWFLCTVSCFSGGLPWKQTDFSSGKWVPAGTVLYLPFDEGTGLTAYDQSGYGNTGTLTNGPSWVDGKYGKALEFTYSLSNYVNVNDANSLDQTTELTVMSWIKTKNNVAPSSYYTFVSKGSYTVSAWDMFLNNSTSTSMKVSFRINYPTTTSSVTGAAYDFTSGWRHIALTFKDGVATLYVDGVQDAQATLGRTSIIANSNAVKIATEGGRYLDGFIDDFMIFDRALSKEEISLLFRISNTFYSGGTYTSSDYDCGNTFTLGRVSWNTDIPPGCSVTLQVSTAGSQSALGSTWSGTTVITPQNSNSDTGLNVAPGRWIRWRAIVNVPSGSSAPIVFKEIKLTPAVQGITTLSNGSASLVLKLNATLQFDIDFSVDMSQSKSCSITIKTEGGSTLSAIGGTWQSSRKFKSSTYTINSGTGSGFADVYITGAQTLAGTQTFYYYPRCFIVDTANIVSVGKTAFFPDPFSPNSDGKAEETSLFFNLSTPQEVILRIYTLKGTLVRSLKENETLQGNVEIRWNGKDDSGKLCPIGVYLYSLRTGTQVKNGTVVLSK